MRENEIPPTALAEALAAGDTLGALGEFLRDGAVERLKSRLADKGYRLETQIT